MPRCQRGEGPERGRRHATSGAGADGRARHPIAAGPERPPEYFQDDSRPLSITGRMRACLKEVLEIAIRFPSWSLWLIQIQ